jgi:dynein heavy chain
MLWLQTGPLPEPWATRLSPLQRLIVLRCLRPHRLVPAVQVFVAKYPPLGPRYIEPPAFDLASAYADALPQTPLVFVLSPGVDPAQELMRFAETNLQAKNLVSVSLGQGQGVVAAEAVKQAAKRGTWVLLQNCHLAGSWMPALERLLDEVTPMANKQFRLWLTAMPSPAFPPSLLQVLIPLSSLPLPSRRVCLWC